MKKPDINETDETIKAYLIEALPWLNSPSAATEVECLGGNDADFVIFSASYNKSMHDFTYRRSGHVTCTHRKRTIDFAYTPDGEIMWLRGPQDWVRVDGDDERHTERQMFDELYGDVEAECKAVEAKLEKRRLDLDTYDFADDYPFASSDFDDKCAAMEKEISELEGLILLRNKIH